MRRHPDPRRVRNCRQEAQSEPDGPTGDRPATRNAFRGQPRSFAGDAQALAGASAMVGARQDEALAPFMRAFVYMPFEHAEGLAMQDTAVRLFSRLAAVAPELGSTLEYALRHRAVIERFGRFPHRNAILGRASTAEEIAYLGRHGSSF